MVYTVWKGKLLVYSSKSKFNLGLVLHDYNGNYSRGWGRNLRPVWATQWDPGSKEKEKEKEREREKEKEKRKRKELIHTQANLVDTGHNFKKF